MSVQVARAGQVILTLGDLDELRAEVDAGRVLPTDHYIVLGMPSWRLVSTLPEEPMAPIARPAPDPTEIARGQIERARAQIMELVNARPFPRPSQCKHCGGAELRSAKLVWQQSTRVGGAVDTNLDITVFGSSTLQALDITPPPEPELPSEHTGGCIAIFVSIILFMFVFDLVAWPLILAFEHVLGGERPEGFARFVTAVVGLSIFALACYLAFRAARGLYRWDKRRSGRDIDGQCAQQIERAKLHVRWRNTWICMSCGGKTVVVG